MILERYFNIVMSFIGFSLPVTVLERSLSVFAILADQICSIFSFALMFGLKSIQNPRKNTSFGTCFDVVLLYVWLETHSKTYENLMFGHVFQRRTSIRSARNPFKNLRKSRVLACVSTSYLYTVGLKSIQKPRKNMCFGTCFDVVFLYVRLEIHS